MTTDTLKHYSTVRARNKTITHGKNTSTMAGSDN